MNPQLGVDESTFAPATEFVFSSPAAHAVESPDEHRLENGLRTLLYLALARNNHRYTLHSFVQDLFPNRRPVLRVGPSPIGGEWACETSSQDDGLLSEGVPAVLRIGIPSIAKFAAVRPLLDRVLGTQPDGLLQAFSETIWEVADNRLWAFPWDGYNDGQEDCPATIGKAADAVIEGLASSPHLQEVWTLLGADKPSLSGFSQALRGCVDCSALKAASLTRAHRTLLANALFFDSNHQEHRQVPIPIGTSGDNRAFLPAGMYLVTYDTTKASASDGNNSDEELFKDVLTRANALHISNHASRFILSAAASRTLHKELEARVEVEQGYATSAAHKKRADEMEELVTTVIGETLKINRMLRNELPEPVRLRNLWFGEDTPLEAVTHVLFFDPADITQRVRIATDRARDVLDKYYAGGLYESRLQRLAAAKDQNELFAIAEEFKALAREWFPGRFEKCLPDLVAEKLRVPLAKMFNDQSKDYPSSPEIWAEALRGYIKDAKRPRLSSFITNVEVNGTRAVRAGFIVASEHPPTSSVLESVRRRNATNLDLWGDVSFGVRDENGDIAWIGEAGTLPTTWLPTEWLALAAEGLSYPVLLAVFAGRALPPRQ